jgi:hypothetical protein
MKRYRVIVVVEVQMVLDIEAEDPLGARQEAVRRYTPTQLLAKVNSLDTVGAVRAVSARLLYDPEDEAAQAEDA